jgi:hypothetical protein
MKAVFRPFLSDLAPATVYPLLLLRFRGFRSLSAISLVVDIHSGTRAQPS